MEHEVGCGGGASDGHAVAVDHEAVGHDIDMRMGGGEVFEVLPVDCRPVTVQ